MRPKERLRNNIIYLETLQLKHGRTLFKDILQHKSGFLIVLNPTGLKGLLEFWFFNVSDFFIYDLFAGSGGFGVVYHADRYLAKSDGIRKDPRWNECAIKVLTLPSGSGPRVVEMSDRIR